MTIGRNIPGTSIYKNLLVLIGTLFGFFLLINVSCSHLSMLTGSNYDRRSISVQTLGLFNQKISPAPPAPSLNGDWIFRRKRLSKISNEIARSKPDVLFLQEVLSKQDNPYEDDTTIIKKNLQTDYRVYRRFYFEHLDTSETEYLSILISPIVPLEPSKLNEENQSTAITVRPLMFAKTILFEGSPVLLINVSLPHESIFDNVTYETFYEKLRESLISFACPNRVIIAGFFPGAQFLTEYKRLLQRLKLKESDTGLCQSPESCYTKSLQNEIFLHTHNGEKEEQSDLILVSQSTLIEASSRAFDGTEANDPYFLSLGFSKVFSSRRFGWQSTLRLPKCVERLD